MTPEGVPSSLLPPKTAGDLLVACGIAEDNFVALVLERTDREGIDREKLWNDVLNDLDVTRVLEIMRSVLLHFAASFIGLTARAPSFEQDAGTQDSGLSLPSHGQMLDQLCDELALAVGCERVWARGRAKDILGDLPFHTQRLALESALFAVGKQHFDVATLPSYEVDTRHGVVNVPAVALWEQASKIIFGLALSFALGGVTGGLR